VASEPKKGRIQKVILVDKEGSPVAASSAQLPEDEFSYGGQVGLQEPPFNPEQLLTLAERHPTHGAALEQKAADIAGTGWEWEAVQESADQNQRKELEAWFAGLADFAHDETTGEILLNAWNDVETIGHGGIEVARDASDKVRKIFSIPGHTYRFHKDGVKIAQGRTGKRTWFKRWLPDDTRVLNRKSGRWAEEDEVVSPDDRANEILIFRRPSRRSSWYGVPAYVSCLGWISLSLAARDDNIHFFNNRREPRWAIILTNLEEDGDLETQLRDAFATGLDKPHRNILIPIEGDGKVDFKQLSSDAKDISFDRLQERASSEILVSHRIPPDRLGAVRVGPLGGNATMAASIVYKEAVVTTSQELLANRVNRFIATEAPVAKPLQWKWKPRELDLTSEAEDTSTVTGAFAANLMTWDEARKRLKLPALEDRNRGNQFFFEIVGTEAAGQVAAAGAAAAVGGRLGATAGARQNLDSAVRAVDERVRAALIGD
jgi:PBSX family phage portal protein